MSLCNKISGPGYSFGFINELVFVDQSEAIVNCKRDVAAGEIINGEFRGLIENQTVSDGYYNCMRECLMDPIYPDSYKNSNDGTTSSNPVEQNCIYQCEEFISQK